MPPPSKRWKTNISAVEEIVFDTFARQEYLSGFHKRKLQRAKYAQELAEKRAREERIAERRRLRKDRKEELERHIEAMKATTLPRAETATEDESEDGEQVEEWNGIPDAPAVPTDIAHEAEYIEEERYTTVTVEAMDVSKEGIYNASRADDDAHEDWEPGERRTAGGPNVATKRAWTKDKPKLDKPKKKKKKFRYESKADRKVTRLKEKSGNKKQARARRLD